MKILKNFCLHDYTFRGPIVSEYINYKGYAVYNIWSECNKCGKKKIRKILVKGI